MQALEEAIFHLPERFRAPILRIRDRIGIDEIRLRVDLPASVTGGGENFFLGASGIAENPGRALKIRKEELDRLISGLCEQSLYRYEEPLRRGYLTTPSGLRAGFCGAMLYDPHLRDWKPDPGAFCGVNLRLPRKVCGAADALVSYFEKTLPASSLIYSPPGAGKTTLLRDLAARLSLGGCGFAPLRVAVIDERRELFPERSGFADSAGLLDILSGLPKTQAFERAVRLLNPQALICDELGGEEDAQALIRAGNAGCLFFASVHAADRAQLMRRPGIENLIRARAFTILCGIRLEGQNRVFEIEKIA